MKYFIDIINNGKHSEKIKFVIVGGLNTIVDFFSFTLMFKFIGIDERFSQAAAYMLGLTNSYILNKIWTFEDKGSKRDIKQIISFIIVNTITGLLSVYMIYYLLNILNINFIISKIYVTITLMGLNFFGYKLFVFKNKF